MSDTASNPAIHPVNIHLAEVLNPLMLAQLGGLSWDSLKPSARMTLADNYASNGSIHARKPDYAAPTILAKSTTPRLLESQMPDGARQFMASGRKLEAWGLVVAATDARSKLQELKRTKTYADAETVRRLEEAVLAGWGGAKL